MFRDLKADEVEVRVGTVGAKGVVLLLYKDARADMVILDETVGPLNWKREHIRENKNCIVSIWNKEIKEWVGKEDTGIESYTEAEKGMASDSFKRACVNWGIGRELYTSPFIFVGCETVKNDNGKGYRLKDKYQFNDIKIKNIIITDKKITGLEILDKTNKTIYKLGAKQPTREEQKPPTTQYIGKAELDQLTAINLVNEVKSEILRGLGYGSSKVIPLNKFNEVLQAFKKAEE